MADIVGGALRSPGPEGHLHKPAAISAGGALATGRCGLGSGMDLDQVFQRAPCGLAVFELDLAVGHGQQSLGRAGMIGELGRQTAVALDRLLVGTVGVLGVAQPVQHGWRVAAVGIAAQQARIPRSGRTELRTAQQLHGRVEVALFLG